LKLKVIATKIASHGPGPTTVPVSAHDMQQYVFKGMIP